MMEGYGADKSTVGEMVYPLTEKVIAAEKAHAEVIEYWRNILGQRTEERDAALKELDQANRELDQLRQQIGMSGPSKAFDEGQMLASVIATATQSIR